MIKPVKLEDFMRMCRANKYDYRKAAAGMHSARTESENE